MASDAIKRLRAKPDFYLENAILLARSDLNVLLDIAEEAADFIHRAKLASHTVQVNMQALEKAVLKLEPTHDK